MGIVIMNSELGILNVGDFISKYKIKPSLAVGFKSHLHAEDATELFETDLINQYKDFSGVQLQSDNVILSDDVRTGRDLSLPVEGNPSDNVVTKSDSLPENAILKKEKNK